MFHRLSTWWRALGVVLLSLASLVWPSSARALSQVPSPLFSVAHQDASTTLAARGVARFHLGLSFASHFTGTVTVALYSHAVTRSALDPVINGTGLGTAPLSSTGAIHLDCAPLRTQTFTISLLVARPTPVDEPCGARALNLHLPCRANACDGVYPLVFTVREGTVTRQEWSLIALQASPVVRPLSLAWISSVGPSAWTHSERATRDFDAIAHQSLPLSLGLDYRTLNDALQATTARASAWRSALGRALTNPQHRAVAAPPGTIDFGGLGANALSTQVALQLSLTNDLLTSLNGRFIDSSLVLSGTPSLASVVALSRIGVRDAVIPEGALTVPPSSTLSWGAPFHVPGASLTALATDQPLANLAIDTSIEPGRRAAMVLAMLAFLHFEAPNAPAVRNVVISAPLAYTSPAFLDQFLTGLSHSPFVRASNLTPSFDSSLVATNGAPATRSMVRAGEAPWSAHNVDSLRVLIGAVTSYADAVASKSVSQGLRVAVASAEVIGSASARQDLITRANNKLSSQLKQFSIDPSTITLAGTGSALPVTLFSRAPYPVTVAVHFQASGITFPSGSSVAVTLSAPATSLRVPIGDAHANSATLQVSLTTPNGQVELARAAIQLRIAGASLVGYLLTLASLAVLAVWWWRTVRHRRKGRHAR
jgi:hypothetical protein